MRYLIATIAVLGTVAAAVFAAIPTTVSTSIAKAEIVKRISAWTGETVTLRGEPVVTVFPSASVEVTDVTVLGANGAEDRPLITIPSLKASLRMLPLLLGRVEVEALTLANPQIHLVGDGTGNGNWSVSRTGRKIAYRSVFFPDSDARVGDIILRDGAITLEDDRIGGTDAITSVNLRIARQRTTATAAISGNFVWRGAMVEVDIELDDPWTALSGSGSRGRLTLTVEPASPSLERGADLRQPDSLATEADGSGLSSSGSFVERIGISDAPSLPFGRFGVAGRFTANATSLMLSDATFELDGNAAKGDLSLRLGRNRPILEGSLAFNELDLGPYVKVLWPKSLAKLLALPVSAAWLAYADVDLDVSANEVSVGAIHFTGTDVSFVVRDDQMTLDLREAGLAGGRMEGRVTIDPAKEGVAAHLSGRLVDVSITDVGRAFWAMRANQQLIGTDKPPQGTGAAMVDLTASGQTIGTIVASLSGWAVADVRDGSIDGADIVSTLERLSGGNTIIAQGKPFIPVAGRTYFVSLAAHASAGAGVVRAEPIRIAGDRFEIRLWGGVDLEDGEVEAAGTASLLSAGAGVREGHSHPAVELPFGMGGTIREPVVAPGIPRIGHHVDANRPSRTLRRLSSGRQNR